MTNIVLKIRMIIMNGCNRNDDDNELRFMNSC